MDHQHPDPRHPYPPDPTADRAQIRALGKSPPPELSPAFLPSQPEPTEESPKAQVGTIRKLTEPEPTESLRPLSAAELDLLLDLLNRLIRHPAHRTGLRSAVRTALRALSRL